jgi:hypothetical protein
MLGETMGLMSSYELADYEALKSYLERLLRLVRQLGAKRFEAQALGVEGRMLHDCGQRAEAETKLRGALAICREAGTQFCGPKVVGALSRMVEDPAESDSLLAEGKLMLERGTVGHNHLWFYRDAIEAKLAARDAEGALGYVRALENYTSAEPLPWSELFAARGRVLATALGGPKNEAVGAELGAIRASLERVGLAAFLPRVNAMIAS